MINVLVNAYAVNPYWGSEQGMGWNWVVNIARYCNVYVITEGEFRDNIEEAMMSLSQKAMLSGNWWILVIPGFFLISTIISVTEVGEYLKNRSRNESYL